MTQQYSDQQRIAALAVLESNGDRLRAASRETGVPVGTLSRWRDEARSAEPERFTEHLEHGKRDWGALFGAALEESVAVTRRKLPEASPRDAGIITGILSDKYLDHTQGRKAGVMVDNRSVSIDHLTDEQLEQLANAVSHG